MILAWEILTCLIRAFLAKKVSTKHLVLRESSKPEANQNAPKSTRLAATDSDLLLR